MVRFYKPGAANFGRIAEMLGSTFLTHFQERVPFILLFALCLSINTQKNVQVLSLSCDSARGEMGEHKSWETREV